MNKRVGLIQARTGSTRLPGKTLLPLGDQVLVERVIERSKEFCEPKLVVPFGEYDVFKHFGIDVFEGSEKHVLLRFQNAITHWALDQEHYVFRITSDCAWLSGAMGVALDRLADWCDFDYASFVEVPKGTAPEILNVEALMRIKTEDPYEREHVLPHMYRNLDKFLCIYLKGTDEDQSLQHLDLSIDTRVDYLISKEFIDSQDSESYVDFAHWVQAMKGLVR